MQLPRGGDVSIEDDQQFRQVGAVDDDQHIKLPISRAASHRCLSFVSFFFFVERLFEHVIVPEPGIVGVSGTVDVVGMNDDEKNLMETRHF